MRRIRWKKHGLGLLLLALLALASFLIYDTLHPRALAPNLIEGTGRIDGDLINLSCKYPGRIEKMMFEEGERVRKDQVLVRLSSGELEARKEEIEAQIKAKKRELEAKRVELSIASRTIPLRLAKAKTALEGAKAAHEELRRRIEAQRRVWMDARRDEKRIRALFAKRLVSKATLEKATLKSRTDYDALEALRRQEAQLLQKIEAAGADLKEARIYQRKIEALKIGLDAFKEAIEALEASKKRIEATMSELVLRAPVEGFVVEKIANQGEVVAAGMPVATLIAPESLYLTIFVDTIENGKIKVGDKAEIFLDAAPDRPIMARVTQIAQRAEFTPKEVSVRSDRIQRVFAVRLRPLRPDPLLKLGIPAIGVISLDGKGLPRSLREIPPL